MEQELTEIEKEVLTRANTVATLLKEAQRLLGETEQFAKEHNVNFTFPDRSEEDYGDDDDEEEKETKYELEDAKSTIESRVFGLLDSVGWNSSSIGC